MKRAFFQEVVTLLGRGRIWKGILGIAVLCWILAGYYMVLFPGCEILFYLNLINADAPMIVSYAICAYVYADTYCMERQKAISCYIVPRVGIASYVVIRTTVGFFAAFFCMLAGKLLFVLTASLWFPLILPEGSGIRQFAAEGWGLRDFLLQGHIWIYFLWVSAVQGIFAGVLCVASQLFSLFVKHSIFVIGFPMILNYLMYNYLDAYLHVPSWLSWLRIYDATYPYFPDGIQLMYTVGYSFLLIAIMGFFSYRKVKGDFYA